MGVSRSQLVRDAVGALIDPPDDADIPERNALAYPDATDGVDYWGDLDAWHGAANAARATAERDQPRPEVTGNW